MEGLTKDPNVEVAELILQGYKEFWISQENPNFGVSLKGFSSLGVVVLFPETASEIKVADQTRRIFLKQK